MNKPKMMRQCKRTAVCDVLSYKDCYGLLLPWWSTADIEERVEKGEQLWTPYYFFYPIKSPDFSDDPDMERLRAEGYADDSNE